MSDSRASYRLVVSSPQGGSAKTTTAEALAWWAAHHKVRAVVSSERKAPSEGDEASEPRLTIVDAPRLGTPIARRALLDADGVLLTFRADVGGLRAMPLVCDGLLEARRENPRLELLGLLLVAWDAQDANQQLARRSFEEQFGALIRDPPAPFQRTLFEWPLRSRENVFAAPLPAGPATDVYERVFNRLRPRFV